MKTQFTYWFALVALIVSIITMILFFIKVAPNSIVDGMTFISIMAAFIGLSVTLLIGYQIYNAMEIKAKLSEITTLRSEIDDIKQKTNTQQNELNDAIYILQSRNTQLKNTYNPYAFLHFLAAIPFSLSLPDRKDSYKYMLDELKDNMMHVMLISFGTGTKKTIEDAVKRLKDLYKEHDEAIRNHENYYLIRDRYEELMSKFEIRLGIIAEMKNPSLLHLDMESGEEPEYKSR